MEETKQNSDSKSKRGKRQQGLADYPQTDRSNQVNVKMLGFENE